MEVKRVIVWSLIFSVFSNYGWYWRIIPVAYNEQVGKFFILLIKNPAGEWADFNPVEVSKKHMDKRAAVTEFYRSTGIYIDPKIKLSKEHSFEGPENGWGKNRYYFMPVTYIPAKDIFDQKIKNNKKNNIVKDVAWVSIEDFLDSDAFTYGIGNENAIIEPQFYELVLEHMPQEYLDNVHEQKENRKKQTAQQEAADAAKFELIESAKMEALEAVNSATARVAKKIEEIEAAAKREARAAAQKLDALEATAKREAEKAVKTIKEIEAVKKELKKKQEKSYKPAAQKISSSKEKHCHCTDLACALSCI